LCWIQKSLQKEASSVGAPKDDRLAGTISFIASTGRTISGYDLAGKLNKGFAVKVLKAGKEKVQDGGLRALKFVTEVSGKPKQIVMASIRCVETIDWG